jgi:hypothetical protein
MQALSINRGRPMLPILPKAFFVAAAAAAVGLSAAPKSGVHSVPAYSGSITRLEATDFATDARRVFRNADLDASGDLDSAEYVALAIVDAELARLNGFIAFEFNGAAMKVAAAGAPTPSAMTFAERTRIDAVATREFHALAGRDARLNASEFESAAVELFTLADGDRDGAIAGAEFALIAAARLRAGHDRA